MAPRHDTTGGNTVAKRISRQSDPSKVEDRIKDAQARIEAATQSFRDGESWQAYLRHAARFHKYSYNNQLLIWSQSDGTATHVAGFKAWLERERVVRKGEKALWIYAPLTKKKDDGETEVFGFRLVPVFDIAQTDIVEGAKHPFIPLEMAPANGDEATGLALYDRLVEAALALGVSSVTRGASSGNAHYQPSNKSIVIEPDRSACEAAMLLAHEIAHHLTWRPANDEQALSYPQGELIAEATAFVVGCYFGIESELRSSHYVAAWQNENSDVSFSKGMSLIQSAAKRIIGAAEKIAGALAPATEDVPIAA